MSYANIMAINPPPPPKRETVPYYKCLDVDDEFSVIRLRSIEAWQPEVSEEDMAMAMLSGDLLVRVRLTSGKMVNFKLLSQEGSRRLLKDTKMSIREQIEYCFAKLGEEWLKS